MSKVTLVASKLGSGKDKRIILYYTCADGRLKYYTRESAPAGKWPNGLNKGTRAQLNRITDTVEQLAVDYRVKGKPLMKAVLKASLDKLIGKSQEAGNTVFDAMTGLIDKMESGKILTPKTKKKYSKGSIKTFRFTVAFLKQFDPGMTISGITLDTYNRFIVWCQEKNYSTNYIGSQIKNWKSLCKAIGGNPVFNDPAFKKLQEDSFNISLDEKELGKMFNLKLTGKRELANDWFILDSYVGLRVSDIGLLQERNIGKKFITIANEKTDFKVVVPIHPRVRAILKKYNGLPPRMSDNDINKLIKGVARQAGINDNVLYTITKGGVRHDEYLKKYEMVSCHTARRNFVTNMRKNHVPDSVVMKLTGIKAIQTIQRYDKLTPDEAADIAAGLKFFK